MRLLIVALLLFVAAIGCLETEEAQPEVTPVVEPTALPTLDGCPPSTWDGKECRGADGTWQIPECCGKPKGS